MRPKYFRCLSALASILSSAVLMGQETELLIRFKNPTTQAEAASASSEIESAATIQDAQDARETFIKSLLDGFNQDVSQSGSFSAAIQAVGGGELTVMPNTDGYIQENSRIQVFAAAASQSLVITPKAGNDGAIATIVAQIKDSTDVEYVELPFIQGFPIEVPVFSTPQASNSETWARDRIGADRIGTTYTGRGVKVAVLDSGILQSHPDFQGRSVGTGVSFTATSPTSDTIGHGTFVAGIIGGNRVGIAKNATLIPYQIFAAGRRSSLEPMKAFERALGDGVDIVNMSIGMPYVGSRGKISVLLNAWNDAFEKAKLANVIHVSAAGNHEDKEIQAQYNALGLGQDFGDVLLPGGSTKTICVAATTQGTSNPNADFSRPISGVDNRTVRPVDISAPGQDVFSATVNGGYSTSSGTSFATPYVTGAMALLREKNPRITQEEALSLLRSTAKPLSNRNRQGAGLLDLPTLLGGIVPPPDPKILPIDDKSHNERIARLDKNIGSLTDIRNYWARRVGRSVDTITIDPKAMEELKFLRTEVPRLQREIVRLNNNRPDLKGTIPFPDSGAPKTPVPEPPDEVAKALTNLSQNLVDTNKSMKDFVVTTTKSVEGLEEAHNNLLALLVFSFEPTSIIKAPSDVTTAGNGPKIKLPKGTKVRVLTGSKPDNAKMVYIQFLTKSTDDKTKGSPVLNVGMTLASNIESASSDAKVKPTPADAKVKPTPADTKVKPAPADTKVKPAPADATVKPAPADNKQ